MAQSKTAAFLLWQRDDRQNDDYFSVSDILKHPRFKQDARRSIFQSVAKLDAAHYLDRELRGTHQNPCWAYRLRKDRIAAVRRSIGTMRISNLIIRSSVLFAEDEVFDAKYFNTLDECI